MTSGNLSAVRSTETEIGDAMRSVRENVELIRYAAGKPNWSSPDARTSFNMSAWTSRAAADVCFIRLNRAKLAVERAGDLYRWMDDAATAEIEHWRTEKRRITDPLSLLLLRTAVMVRLAAIETGYAMHLAQVGDFLETDPLTVDQREWLANGLARAMRRDLERGRYPGPPIPETLATGNDDAGWVPQGLGFDRATGLLLQTSYQNTDDDAAGEGAQLSLIDPDTGELMQTVELAGYPREEGGETPPPDHAGGVAVHNGVVWVTSSGDPGHVYPYSMSEIRDAASDTPVRPLGEPQEVAGAAYSTIHGDTLYVGTFEQHGPGKMYAYSWDSGTESWELARGPMSTPPQTQGVAVRGDRIVFSTSWGRDNASSLQSYDLDTVHASFPGALLGVPLGEPRDTVPLPNMAEGVARLPSGLFTTYESGAADYADPRDSPLEELWAAMNMTVTPYDELGLAGRGIDVEPSTLREASRLFDEAEAGLNAVERMVDALSLPAGCLGETAGATPFAVAVTRHCDITARWLRRGTLATGVTASGLIDTATDYETTDNDSGSLFSWLRDLVS